MFTISLLSRDFTHPIADPGLAWTVERITWRAMGGPAEARLRIAAGSMERLFALADWLRCPLTISDDLGPCWWGYLSAVTFYGGPAPLRIDLETMTNRVAVSYQEITPHAGAGPRVMTAWAEDAPSVAAYGAKERVVTVGPSTAADASALAQAMVGQYGEAHLTPLAPLSIAWRGGKREAADGTGITNTGYWWAEVEAKGWWDTLGWRYYAEPRGQVGHLTVGTSCTWGAGAANAKVAGSFQVGAEGWLAAEAWVRIRRVRATDYARLELCADNAGSPGAVLTSAMLPAGALADDWTWARFAFPGPAALAPGAVYWLVLSRTGALSEAACYAVSVDEGLGYPAGALRIWDGAGWAARSPDADLNFLVTGAESTTAQIARMLASSPFIRQARIECPPGISARLYRDGSKRALEEVEDLLAMGAAGNLLTGSAPLRLLATVEPDRTARVYAPGGGAGDGDTAGVLGIDGAPCAESGRPLRPSEQPCGRWLRLGPGSPPGGPGRVFAESVVWEEGGMRVE